MSACGYCHGTGWYPAVGNPCTCARGRQRREEQATGWPNGTEAGLRALAKAALTPAPEGKQ